MSHVFCLTKFIVNKTVFMSQSVNSVQAITCILGSKCFDQLCHKYLVAEYCNVLEWETS